VLKKPMVVVRNSTERPEAVAAGFARMARPAEIEDAVAIMAAPAVAARLAALACPFGDGRAGQRIAAATCLLADGRSPAPATVVRLIRR
jgi:UDP-N-acetylglucosamine 2-epimerase (non-hydrolysing)